MVVGAVGQDNAAKVTIGGPPPTLDVFLALVHTQVQALQGLAPL